MTNIAAKEEWLQYGLNNDVTYTEYYMRIWGSYFTVCEVVTHFGLIYYPQTAVPASDHYGAEPQGCVAQ